MRRVRLSAQEARRIALAAQGFDRARPECTSDVRHFRRVMDHLGLLQLDYVNVLMPAHFLVLWSRLGPYDRSRFEKLIYKGRGYIEQWAHEASIVPSQCWPLLEYRRRAWRMHPYNPLRKLRNRKAYLARVLQQVHREGPLTAHDLPAIAGGTRKPGDWHRSVPRWALEYHFARGDVAIAGRLPNFQRVYDIAERVVPAEHFDQSHDDDDARRELLRIAASGLGIATLQDLADYFRMSPRNAAPHVQHLVEAGDLVPIAVDGWQEQAYLWKDARIPRSISGASLLSPFDPVVWFRPRAERLFDFHYRIEIYVPAAQRKWGYYVLPFRVGDEIVARVDLKADRKTGKLRVLATHEEQGIERDTCMECLAAELRALGEWLQLDEVDVTRHNPESRRLANAV